MKEMKAILNKQQFDVALLALKRSAVKAQRLKAQGLCRQLAEARDEADVIADRMHAYIRSVRFDGKLTLTTPKGVK